jgi:hypothetical protein
VRLLPGEHGGAKPAAGEVVADTLPKGVAVVLLGCIALTGFLIGFTTLSTLPAMLPLALGLARAFVLG